MTFNTEMGEFFVGAYLKLISDCEFVAYNQTYQSGKDVHEVDVIGFNIHQKKIIICEVATQLNGLNYGSRSAKDVIENKFVSHINHFGDKFPKFDVIYQFWSPKVPVGRLTKFFDELNVKLRKNYNSEIRFIYNDEYTKKIIELKDKAKTETKDTGEPFYRVLQILEHLHGH